MNFSHRNSQKMFFVMEKTSKDVCEEVKNFPADMTEGMNQAGLDQFEALVCGREGIPLISYHSDLFFSVLFSNFKIKITF